jgi:hypothetical protein
MTCHCHYRHQAGHLFAGRSLVNARNTSTKKLTCTIDRRRGDILTLQKYHCQSKDRITVVILELKRCNCRANTLFLSRTSLPGNGHTRLHFSSRAHGVRQARFFQPSLRVISLALIVLRLGRQACSYYWLDSYILHRSGLDTGKPCFLLVVRVHCG